MIKLENIQKNYKDFSLNCSLEVKKGHITALIGQNGAGKTTTFKAILDLIKTEGGKITIFGKDISEITSADKEHWGVVLSDATFNKYFKLKDVAKILKYSYKDFDEKFFFEQAEKFGLPIKKKISEFSTGMTAKFKVLVAISHNADLLILDEPTSGLDIVARDELLLILKEYMEKDENRAILISSHISSDLEALCDDIYILHEGCVILHENTDVLLSEYAILKLSNEDFENIDKQYILYTKQEPYGISALTNQKQFYSENYPEITIEKGNIDNCFTMIVKGEKQ